MKSIFQMHSVSSAFPLFLLLTAPSEHPAPAAWNPGSFPTPFPPASLTPCVLIQVPSQQTDWPCGLMVHSGEELSEEATKDISSLAMTFQDSACTE